MFKCPNCDLPMALNEYLVHTNSCGNPKETNTNNAASASSSNNAKDNSDSRSVTSSVDLTETPRSSSQSQPIPVQHQGGINHNLQVVEASAVPVSLQCPLCKDQVSMAEFGGHIGLCSKEHGKGGGASNGETTADKRDGEDYAGGHRKKSRTEDGHAIPQRMDEGANMSLGMAGQSPQTGSAPVVMGAQQHAINVNLPMMPLAGGGIVPPLGIGTPTSNGPPLSISVNGSLNESPGQLFLYRQPINETPSRAHDSFSAARSVHGPIPQQQIRVAVPLVGTFTHGQYPAAATISQFPLQQILAAPPVQQIPTMTPVQQISTVAPVPHMPVAPVQQPPPQPQDANRGARSIMKEEPGDNHSDTNSSDSAGGSKALIDAIFEKFAPSFRQIDTRLRQLEKSSLETRQRLECLEASMLAKLGTIEGAISRSRMEEN